MKTFILALASFTLITSVHAESLITLVSYPGSYPQYLKTCTIDTTGNLSYTQTGTWLDPKKVVESRTKKIPAQKLASLVSLIEKARAEPKSKYVKYDNNLGQLPEFFFTAYQNCKNADGTLTPADDCEENAADPRFINLHGDKEGLTEIAGPAQDALALTTRLCGMRSEIHRMIREEARNASHP